ncbi:hypothetical protein F0562_008176 [Nyssa sinensis]|uniref:Transcription factor CBF/NF-Y/archaeal histone domain-containing protein n=1 Tax=Nyssa sinensis TaxID=561372 RepID=A0A5J5ABB1_9ASTE|nr:hypothetical protein F0562_008176 [Nyssa sinensis]
MEDEALSSDQKCLQPVLEKKKMEDEALSSDRKCLQPVLVEKLMEPEAISSDQKCLQPVLVEKSMEAEALSSDQACFASKLEFERENITEKKEAHESGVDQVYDYIVRSPDSFSESESIDHLSTSEGSEVEWPYSGDVAESPDCSDDDSISDEESLIEIALPSGHYSGPEEEEEEPKSNLQNNFSDFSPESLFREGSLMELSPEGNEMNEEENLIEIDISMGSIKCSRIMPKLEKIGKVLAMVTAFGSMPLVIISRKISIAFVASPELNPPVMEHDSDNESGGHNSHANSELSAREQDRFLPIANVSRIMKKALPANAKISKDAKETVQECVSEFISFITGEASDKCQREKRKTINGDDLLWAMTTLGFEEYVEPLKIYLAKYREMEGEKSTMGRQGEKDGSEGGGAAAGGGVSSGSGGVAYNGGVSGGGMYGGMQTSMMMMGGHHHHQGQIYSPGSFHHMGVGGGGGGGGGSGVVGKSSSGGVGGGASTVRPR